MAECNQSQNGNLMVEGKSRRKESLIKNLKVTIPLIYNTGKSFFTSLDPTFYKGGGRNKVIIKVPQRYSKTYSFFTLIAKKETTFLISESKI